MANVKPFSFQTAQFSSDLHGAGMDNDSNAKVKAESIDCDIGIVQIKYRGPTWGRFGWPYMIEY